MPKTKPNPGIPHLVVLETQSGTQHQIWYKDSGKFVGEGPIKPTTTKELPADREWTIAEAIAFLDSTKADENGG